MAPELCNDEEHDFVEFGYSPRGLSYYCSKCPKVKIPGVNTPETEIEERHFPINFVFQRGNGDCSIAVLAMALGETYEEAQESCRDYLDPESGDLRPSTMEKFLLTRNEGTFSHPLVDGAALTTHDLNNLCNANTVLIVAIQPFDADEEEIGHVVLYYDDFIYDPQFGVVKAEKYFRRVNWAIVSLILFPKP